MKNPIIVVFALILLMAMGCKSAKKTSFETTAWQPWNEPIHSKEDLNRALQARWPLDRVRSYCKNVEPPKWDIQNLVIMHDEWRSELHSVKGTELDRIYWYADVQNGNLERYSVTATVGEKYWIIEIGNKETLRRPPYLGK